MSRLELFTPVRFIFLKHYLISFCSFSEDHYLWKNKGQMLYARILSFSCLRNLRRVLKILRIAPTEIVNTRFLIHSPVHNWTEPGGWAQAQAQELQWDMVLTPHPAQVLLSSSDHLPHPPTAPRSLLQQAHLFRSPGSPLLLPPFCLLLFRKVLIFPNQLPPILP